MRLAMLQFETKLQKCISIGIAIFQIFIGEVYCRIYGRKSCFTKTKFLTVYPTIYLHKYGYMYSLIMFASSEGSGETALMPRLV